MVVSFWSAEVDKMQIQSEKQKQNTKSEHVVDQEKWVWVQRGPELEIVRVQRRRSTCLGFAHFITTLARPFMPFHALFYAT